MRTDQIIGLTGAAKIMITKMVDCIERGVRIIEGVEEPFERKIRVDLVKKEPSGAKYSGMFDTEYPLYKYTLPNGKVYTEYVQHEPWSSGPCFFLALQDKSGKPVRKSLWSDKEMKKYL
jgi:hypothetical protein